MQRLKKSEIKVLHSIFSREQATRISIARDTRLSLVKVSAILSYLEKSSYIVKAGKTKTRSGRPSYIFQLRPELGHSLGASIELERLHIVAMDSAKQMLFHREFALELTPDPATHVQAIVDQVSKKLQEIIQRELPSGQTAVCLGLALPGMVDSRKGTWLLGLQLSGITHVPIVQLLEQRLELPVFIEDVSRCLAFLEMHGGNGRRIRNFVLVYLGIGMGTGIAINRKIYRGFHGLAGEIGHVEHADNSYRCSCNNVGCLETVVSASGILRVFKDRLKEGVISSLQKHNATDGETDSLSLERILEAARQGDRLAQSTLLEIGQFLGDACSVLIKMFNPQRLIISGKLAMFKDFFAEPVEQVIHRHVLPEMLTDYRTVFADYQAHHEAHGAALMAMNHYLNRRLKALAEGK